MLKETASSLIERLREERVSARYYEKKKIMVVWFWSGQTETAVPISQVYVVEALLERLRKPAEVVFKYRCGFPTAISYDEVKASRIVTPILHEILQTKDWNLIRVLGDALQDCGCDSPEVVEHCNRETHRRDSWLLFFLSYRKLFGATPGSLSATFHKPDVGDMYSRPNVKPMIALLINKRHGKSIAETAELLRRVSPPFISWSQYVFSLRKLLTAPDVIWDKFCDGSLQLKAADAAYNTVNWIMAGLGR